MLTRSSKENICASLQDLFSNSSAVFVVEPSAMSVGDFEVLRIEVRKGGGSVRMIKNTLARKAVQGTQCSDILGAFSGTSVLLAGADSLALAKAIKTFCREKGDLISFKGGVIDGSVVDAGAVKALADMPSFEEMRAQLVGILSSPHSRLVQVLSGVQKSLVGVLSNKVKKGE